MASSYGFKISVGDYGNGATDTLDLNDGVNFAVLLGSFTAPPPANDTSTRTLTLGLLVLGATSDAIWANLHSLETKLRQARQAVGPWGITTPVSLAVTLSSTTVWFDVRDGSWDATATAQSAMSSASNGTPLDTITGGALTGVTLTLECEPYARGAAQSFSSGSLSGFGAHTLYCPGVAGDRDPLTRVTIADSSTTAVTGIHLGRRALTSMASGDAVPVNEVVASSPGTTFTDAGASGGSTARLTASSSWQTIGTVSQPANTPASVGLVDLWLRGRDSETLVGQAGNLSATVLEQPTMIQFTVNTTTYTSATSATGSATWSNATTDGNTLIMLAQCATSGVTITAPGNWGSPTAISGNTTLNAWVWQGAPSQSGSVSVISTATGSTAVVVYLIEVTPGNGVISVATGTANGLSKLTLTPGPSAGLCFVLAGGNASSSSYSANNSYVPLEIYGSTTPAYGGALFTLNASSISAGVTVSCPQTTTEGILLCVGGNASSYGSSLPGGVYTLQLAATNGTAAGAPSNAVSATIQGKGCIQLSWSAASNATAYTLYVTLNGSTTSSSLSGTSTTLAAVPGTSASVPTAPSVAAYRARVGLSGAATRFTGPAVSPAVGGSAREWLLLGTFSLPPQVALDGGTPPPWLVELQGMHPTLTPTLDADLLLWLPHQEPQLRASVSSAATGQSWRADSRRDGRASVTLLSGTTTVDQASPTAPFALGAGDNLLIVRLEQGAGQSAATSIQLTVQAIPRYWFIT